MNEQISALMDDDLSLDDAPHLSTQLQSNARAQEAWQHYHLIGDAMRGTPVLSADFKQNLMLKLEQEPTVLSPSVLAPKVQIAPQAAGASHNLPFWRKKPAMYSVAASLAAVTLVGWMVLGNQQASTLTPAPIELAQTIPTEYLMAHQEMAPNQSAYYIQRAGYAE